MTRTARGVSVFRTPGLGDSVPRVPNPKLIPERDGSGGVSWDAHLCFEVSDACRLLRFALEVLILYLGRSGRVFWYGGLTVDEIIPDRWRGGPGRLRDPRLQARVLQLTTQSYLRIGFSSSYIIWVLGIKPPGF